MATFSSSYCLLSSSPLRSSLRLPPYHFTIRPIKKLSTNSRVPKTLVLASSTSYPSSFGDFSSGSEKSRSKELREAKRKSAALQMQQFVGEEKNDLLDYLRSLQPEKVAELSEPTSFELKETIHSIVHGLLATLSPKMHSKAPPLSESTSTGTVNDGIEEDCTDLVENTSLQFHPLISLTRDYLARLLFWCMLLGHYLRGLEYRLELMELLSLPSDVADDASSGGDEQVA